MLRLENRRSAPIYAARPPEEGGEIVGESILGAGDSSAGYEVEKT